MCGIAGFVGKTSKESLIEMLAALKHRGPDGEGLYWSQQAGLGNRRLAIIDRKGGAQPQTNEDQTLIITFNGEIYNFQDVRKDLARRGHRFKTHSDTEVILHAYEQYGPKCLQEFNGMFAFAIWDSRRKTLFAARDRLGIKPFFYTRTRNNLLFASEIKSLLVHPEVKREVNLNEISSYLTFRYVPEPETMFTNIYHLSAGHYLILKDRKLTIKRYWKLPEGQIEAPKEKEIEAELLELLEDSVRIRLMSEVPVGSYISGGVDSALITAFAAKHNRQVKTFNVAFEDDRYDESKYAMLVNKHLNLIPTTIRSVPTQIASLPEIIWFLDQPLADAAVIPTYMMSKEAKKHAGVVLSGDGADEIFAGYKYYKRLTYGRMLSKAIRLPQPITKMFAENRTLIGKGVRFLERSRDKTKQYLSLMNSFSDADQKQLLKPHVFNGSSHPVAGPIHKYFSTNENHLMQILKLDLAMELTGDILLKTDRMTMAHGLEARVPFLDYRLVEFAMRLPANHKLRGLSDKYIERRIAEKILPKKIAWRKKHGFDVPLTMFHEIAEKTLTREAIKKRDWFYPDKIRAIVEDTHSHAHLRQAFTLLVLELWAQIFLDKKDPRELERNMMHQTSGT
jgi:asparagine synthase (glutamine-hydrolysing)